jgi:hypothetical protein
LAYKFVDSSEEYRKDGGETVKPTDSVDDSRNRHKSNECKHSLDFDEDLMKTNLSRKTKSQENIYSDSQSCEGTCLVNMYDNATYTPIPQAKYSLLWQKSFSCPVIGVDRLDIVGDGLDDLIVVTLKGIHIVQVCLYMYLKIGIKMLSIF